MIWASWGDFFSMGGYALYVWGSVVAVFLSIVVELIGLRHRHAQALAQLRKQTHRTGAPRAEIR
jgi:heme exporter protein D